MMLASNDAVIVMNKQYDADYSDTHKVELAQAFWSCKCDIEKIYADWDSWDSDMEFQEFHMWAVTATIMNIQESVAKMNEYQMKANLKHAAATASRCAGQLDCIDMNLIEYYEGGHANYETARYEQLKADYEEACDEVSYWSAKVYS